MKIEVDLSDMKLEMKNTILEYINRELDNTDFEKQFKKYLSSNRFKKIVKSYIYSYMEEAEIVFPADKPWGKEKKIALNTFVIQIVREIIESRVKLFLEDVLKLEASRYLSVVIDQLANNIKKGVKI